MIRLGFSTSLMAFLSAFSLTLSSHAQTQNGLAVSVEWQTNLSFESSKKNWDSIQTNVFNIPIANQLLLTPQNNLTEFSNTLNQAFKKAAVLGAKDLKIILFGHGDNGIFYLGANTVISVPYSDLVKAIDDQLIQNPGVISILDIFIDNCYSGSAIPEFQRLFTPQSNLEVNVTTSASNEETATTEHFEISILSVSKSQTWVDQYLNIAPVLGDDNIDRLLLVSLDGNHTQGDGEHPQYWSSKTGILTKRLTTEQLGALLSSKNDFTVSGAAKALADQQTDGFKYSDTFADILSDTSLSCDTRNSAVLTLKEYGVNSVSVQQKVINSVNDQIIKTTCDGALFESLRALGAMGDLGLPTLFEVIENTKLPYSPRLASVEALESAGTRNANAVVPKIKEYLTSQNLSSFYANLIQILPEIDPTSFEIVQKYFEKGTTPYTDEYTGAGYAALFTLSKQNPDQIYSYFSTRLSANDSAFKISFANELSYTWVKKDFRATYQQKFNDAILAKIASIAQSDPDLNVRAIYEKLYQDSIKAVPINQ